MKKYLNKITSLMLILCLTIGVFAVSVGNAYAASKKWVLLINEERWVGDASNVVKVCDDNSWGNENGPTYATVTSVKSSNTAVLAAKKETLYYEDHTEKGYLLNSKKAGKATITVKYKTPAGKTGTLKKTITVKKYPKQIKSLKVNGKTVSTSKHKFFFDRQTSKKSVTIKMALKDGWKITDVYGYRYTKSGKESKVKVTKKMLKNGTSISFPKKYEKMSVCVYMENGKSSIYYDVFFNRPQS